jgi:hypothetical protein
VAEIQGKDGAVHCVRRCMPIIIGLKSRSETRSKLLLVRNHDKLTGMDIILTSKCVENYVLSIEIDKTRKNSRLILI